MIITKSRRKFYISRFFLCVSIVLSCLFFSTNLHAGMFEKGDAIYRELDPPYPWFLGHAGIYCYWAGDDTENWTYHHIIEAMPPAVRWNTFQGFYDAAPFWGVYCNNLLNYQLRNTIMELAAAAEDTNYDFFNYKNPGSSFRCDGLVEYCYESVNIDLVENDTWDTIWPAKQKGSGSLTARSGAYVTESSITSPSANATKCGTIAVKADVSDGLFGSGIQWTKFYYDDSEGDSHLIDLDEGSADVSKEAQVSWDTTEVLDGECQVQSIAFDKAGNFKESSKVTVYIDNTKPTVTETKP